ncbi:MAG: EAL domain-containing protein [Propionivibrio sp.]
MRHFHLLESLQRLSAHRWLRAIRHSLVLLLPVTFVGAMALLFGSFPFAAISPKIAAFAGDGGSSFAMLIWSGSSGILSLCLVVLISHFLAAEARSEKLIDVSAPLVATVALVNFFIYAMLSGTAASLSTLGPRSILGAILIAIVSTELFIFCLRSRFLRLGYRSYEFDPGLDHALLAIGPALVTVGAFSLMARVLVSWSPDASELIGAGFASINHTMESQLPGLLLLGLVNQLLWFFGIHGANALESVYKTISLMPSGPEQVFDIPKALIDLYVHIGGSGSTLGLLLAILFQARQSDARHVAKYALIPSLFNINELVLFGLPIVFNPIYLIPFLLAPLLQIVTAYFGIRYGLVATNVHQVPWTTPPFLAGVLSSGSWRGGALQLFNLLLSTLVYLPFVRYAEQRRASESLNAMRRAVRDIEAIKLQRGTVLDRPDGIGHTARKLLHEFMRDLDDRRVSKRVFLAYQPQHDRSGAVIGVEALLRWNHGQFGAISPAVVVGLVEESQQIARLGRWVIRNACRQLHEWKREGVCNVRMSINVSPVQLKDGSLLGLIEDTLAACDLRPAELGIELTESQYVSDDPVSSATLKGLQALGTHLEMDDFGMGYSSMLYVRRFRFSTIKLDGSLTREVLQDNNCSDIISSVVQLGRALGIQVVAEYVETREQQLALEELGCDAFQGYLYSPALVPERCLAYLRKHAFAMPSMDESPATPRAVAVQA